MGISILTHKARKPNKYNDCFQSFDNYNISNITFKISCSIAKH